MAHARTIYQLLAEGPLALTGQPWKVHSKLVFDDREEACRYVEEFKRVCTTPTSERDLGVLDSVREVRILELVLQEGSI